MNLWLDNPGQQEREKAQRPTAVRSGRFPSTRSQGRPARGPLWVTGGKTRSEYMFSELPQIADIAGASADQDCLNSTSLRVSTVI